MDVLLFSASILSVVFARKRVASNDNELQEALANRTSLNATERICLVTPDNEPLTIEQGSGCLRSNMRLHNQWHRATYVLIKHQPEHIEQHSNSLADTYVLVQKRSAMKDYCPGKLDPTPGGVVGYGESYLENATRELKEEMDIDVTSGSRNTLTRLFTFSYEDQRVRVWGDFYECIYRGTLKDLTIQEVEVEEVLRMSLQELKDRSSSSHEDFMPDACHAMCLYFQHLSDTIVNRRKLKGYSSGDLEAYGLRPKPRAVFFDCDDCLYFDGWKTANQLTSKIDEWCVNHGLPAGFAYKLYKQYGTALRGLLAEGYLEDTEEAIDGFLEAVHDIPIQQLIQRDDELRSILLKMDPRIPKYIFTASVADHALRCIRALGIDDLFVDVIDCKKCNLETKHSPSSFQVAMKVAGVKDPERCLFLDDSISNIRAGREVGWRCILVGRVCRDQGHAISSEHAEIEIDRIHDFPSVLPELFEQQ